MKAFAFYNIRLAAYSKSAVQHTVPTLRVYGHLLSTGHGNSIGLSLHMTWMGRGAWYGMYIRIPRPHFTLLWFASGLTTIENEWKPFNISLSIVHLSWTNMILWWERKPMKQGSLVEAKHLATFFVKKVSLCSSLGCHADVLQAGGWVIFSGAGWRFLFLPSLSRLKFNVKLYTIAMYNSFSNIIKSCHFLLEVSSPTFSLAKTPVHALHLWNCLVPNINISLSYCLRSSFGVTKFLLKKGTLLDHLQGCYAYSGYLVDKVALNWTLTAQNPD